MKKRSVAARVTYDEPFVPVTVKGHQPDRATILNSAFACLQQAGQWIDLGKLTLAADWQSRATSLIELLEVWDCGSTGGFDVGQERSDKLVDRLWWLTQKHPANVKFKIDHLKDRRYTPLI